MTSRYLTKNYSKSDCPWSIYDPQPLLKLILSTCFYSGNRNTWSSHHLWIHRLSQCMRYRTDLTGANEQYRQTESGTSVIRFRFNLLGTGPFKDVSLRRQWNRQTINIYLNFYNSFNVFTWRFVNHCIFNFAFINTN